MEDIAEVSEEELSFSSNDSMVEEEIVEDYDNAEGWVDGGSICSEDVVVSEETFEQVFAKGKRDDPLVLETAIADVDEHGPSTNSEKPTDGWRDHFRRQQEHFFDSSLTLLDYYEEEVLDCVYGMSVAINEETPLSSNGSSDDTIMQRLSRKRKEQKKAREDYGNQNIMKILSRRNAIDSKKMYSKGKYHPRRDPYMEELKEIVSTRFRYNEESENLQKKYQEVMEEDGDEESTTEELESSEDRSDSQSIADPPESHQLHTDAIRDVNQTDERNMRIEISKTRIERSPDHQEIESGVGNDNTSQNLDLAAKPQQKPGTENFDGCNEINQAEEEETPTHSSSGIPNDRVETNDDETSSKRSVDEDRRINATDTENLRIDCKHNGNIGKFQSEYDRKDETDSTSFSEDDYSDSSVEVDTVKTRSRSLSIRDPDDQEILKSILEDTNENETSTNLEELMKSVANIPDKKRSIQHPEFENAGDSETSHESKSSAFQKQHGATEKSMLHEFIVKHDWIAMQKYMALLKKEGPHVTKQEMTWKDENTNATPLHAAVTKAPAEITSFLISLIPFQYREDILMAVDDAGNTPLHVACENFIKASAENKAFASIIKIMTLGAPRVHCMRNCSGEIPLSLLLASSGARAQLVGDNGDENVVSDLLEAILKDNAYLIDDRNDDNATLLHTAVANCIHDKVLKTILETKTGKSLAQIRDQHGMLPIHILASCPSGRAPSAKSAKRLVEAYPEGVAQPSSTGDTPLHLFVSSVSSCIADEKATKSSNTSKLAKILLGDGRSQSPLLVRNNDGKFPLHCCVKLKTPLNIVLCLMEDEFATRASTQRDFDALTPLHALCSSSEVYDLVDSIKVIGTKEAALVKNREGNTPLFLAIENPMVTKQVIAAVGAINPAAAKLENAKGISPFHAAIMSKLDESIVKELIKIDPKTVKRQSFKGNNNIFHEMCQYETAPGILTGLLRVHPAGANVQNDKGNLPLHVACAYHVSSKIINALVEAYPEGCLTRNKAKEIPLHYAVGDENARMKNALALLRAAPESILVEDKKGHTPMDVAKTAGVSIEVYEILRKHYKDQSKVEVKSEEQKASRKKKKKKKTDLNHLESSKDLSDVGQKSLGTSKRKKKKKKVGLNDESEPALGDKDEAFEYVSTKSNALSGFHDVGSSPSFHESSKSASMPKKKRKKLTHDRDTDDVEKRASTRNKLKGNGEPMKSMKSCKKKIAIDSEGNSLEKHKSKKKIGKEDADDEILSRAKSERKPKSGKASEGASLVVASKHRKKKMSVDKEPKKSGKTSMRTLLDVSPDAVKSTKSSKSSRSVASNAQSVNGEEERKSRKTSLSKDSKKEMKRKSKTKSSVHSTAL